MSRTRGIVLPLTPQQIVNRWLYLAGARQLADLDDHIRREGAPSLCPAIYYSMQAGHNGGADPTAPDPATRWTIPGRTFTNITADCIAAAAWGAGWDRYQPERFGHIYGGWINTDSMRLDAAGPARCFRRLDAPEPGCLVVYGSDPHHRGHGVAVGHVGGIVGLRRARWEPLDPTCWAALDVVDISARGAGHRANLMRSGSAWYGKDSWFVVSTMTS